METVDHCNLCGGARFSPFAEIVGPASGRRLHVVTCEDCGLRFMSPRMTEREVEALYDEAYFNGRGFDPSINYVDEEAEQAMRGEETTGVLEKIALFKPERSARVLDVGCGTGGLLTALTAAGYRDVWGVELSEYAANLARERSGARVLASDILSADLPAGTFDAINATEVIEHLRDPRAFFARVRELLAPGGVFVYTTGNARCAYARLLGKRWPYLIDGHLYYFDPGTLARYFAEAGLEPTEAGALDRATRSALIRAEGRVAVGVLHLVGRSDRGIKGRIFRLAAALDSPLTRYALTRFLGKDKMPIAFKRA